MYKQIRPAALTPQGQASSENWEPHRVRQKTTCWQRHRQGRDHCDRSSGAQIRPQSNQWVSTVQWGRDQRAHDENDTPALGHLRETGAGGQHSSIMITRSDNSNPEDLQNEQHRKAAPYCKCSR